MPDELSALARFVLDTVDGLRAMTAQPGLAGVALREITFSIPYDPATGTLRLHADALHPTLAIPAVRLPEAMVLLRSIDPRVVFERAQLATLPEQQIARLEITIRL